MSAIAGWQPLTVHPAEYRWTQPHPNSTWLPLFDEAHTFASPMRENVIHAAPYHLLTSEASVQHLLRMIRRILSAIAIAVAVSALGQNANNAPIEAVAIAPLFYQRFACMEHVSGELSDLGDALGSDCLVLGGLGTPNGFLRFYKTNGATNEDWYGWHVKVHAPFNGVVIEVAANRVTNTPGTQGQPPPGYIKFKRKDGVVVVYAHLDDIKVHQSDHVSVGQVVGLCGNNGSARNPHVHVGAYVDKKPLQIRWDLAAEGRIQTLAQPQQQPSR